MSKFIHQRTVDSSSIIQYKKMRISFPNKFRGTKVFIHESSSIRIFNKFYCREIVMKQSIIFKEDYSDSPEQIKSEVDKYLLTARLAGENIYHVCNFFIKTRAHPYLSFRSIEALFFLADDVGCERLDLICEYSLEINKPFYYFIKKIVKGDGIHSV